MATLDMISVHGKIAMALISALDQDGDGDFDMHDVAEWCDGNGARIRNPSSFFPIERSLFLILFRRLSLAARRTGS